MIKFRFIQFNTYLIILSISIFSCHSTSGKRNSADAEKNGNQGEVVKIIDGDTYDLLINSNATVRIRMEGIDAPEKGMPYYKVSKNYLGELCFRKNVRIVKTNTDKFGRSVAKTYLEDGREVGEEMIKAGMAWHFKKYSSDSVLANLEDDAKTKKIGLWKDENAINPSDIRKLHRKGISTKYKFDSLKSIQ
jgi:micrococcal nuclease